MQYKGVLLWLKRLQDMVNLKNIWMLLLFGLTVSLDSFSVGIGISLITKQYLTSYLTFFVVSMFFTFIGLKFGKYLSEKFGIEQI